MDERPLDDRELAGYLRIMHEQRLSPAIAAHFLEAVELRCRLAEIPPPHGPETYTVLEAIRRDGRPGMTAHPTGLRWHQADAAAAAASGTYVTDVRDAANIAVGSDALLRTAEVAALDIEDLAFQGDGTGRLTIRRHNGGGEGATSFLGEPTVVRIRTWLEKAEIRTGALFRAMRAYRPSDRRMSVRGVQLAVTRHASAARFFQPVTSEVLRIGSTLSLAAAGASLDQIVEAGRWTSSAPGDPVRGPVATLRFGARADGIAQLECELIGVRAG